MGEKERNEKEPWRSQSAAVVLPTALQDDDDDLFVFPLKRCGNQYSPSLLELIR